MLFIDLNVTSPDLDCSNISGPDEEDSLDEVSQPSRESLQKFDEEVSRIDLRLKTFQDFGRLYRLYPGSFYDHDKSGWFCAKCKSFAPASSSSNPWISGGM